MKSSAHSRRWPGTISCVVAGLALTGLPSSPAPAQLSDVDFPSETGLLAADGLAERFGRTVEIHNDLAFVGDDKQPGGAVYVHQFDGTVWVPIEKLLGDSGSGMGNSLFVDGDLLVAGDPAGRSAYVFRYDGNTYRREARLRPSDPNANLIATSVGVSGDTIVVSGLQRWPGGVTYVYDWDGLNWAHTATLTVPGASSIFGHCTIQGDTIVIGDTYHDSASVFKRSQGRWQETQRLFPSDSDNEPWSQNFGLPVRIDGDRIAVGAVWDTGQRGAVYVFDRNESGWDEVAKLISQDAVPGDYIGAGLSLEGNRIAVGASLENVDAERSGAVYIFEFDGSDWLQTLRLTRQEAGVECQGECSYGGFLAMSGDRVVVGENGADRAWIYEPISGANVEVAIDIKPFDNRNQIDPSSPMLFSVGILSDDDFDALQTDLQTIVVEPGEASARNYRVYDANRDRIPDLVPLFRARDLRIGCGETEVELTGKTHDGVEFFGTDVVRNRRCPK